MGRSFSTNVYENVYDFGGKREGKLPIEKPRHVWVVSNDRDLK
jgi:hypothetical protein